jgi:lysophospholipase L1-like esterase
VIRGTSRGTWWALLVGGVCGAIVASLVLIVTTGSSDGGVQSASAERPAAASSSAGSDRPSVVFIGDSWTEGSGAQALRGFAVRTAEQLDWTYLVLGVGGSGYDVAGRGSTFAQRIDRAVSVHPDLIVVQGSLNERTSTSESLRPAAIDTLARLRAEADPATRIVVLGASYVPGTPQQTIDWINDDVRQAAAQAGVPFVDVAAQNWTDPLRRGIWADPNHPNDVGHQLIADRLVPILRAQLSP